METMNDRERIVYYLELLKEIGKQVGEEQTAVRILAEISKDRRMAEIKAERNGNGWGQNGFSGSDDHDDPATSKQIAYIKQLGGTPTKNITRKAASTMIDELLGNGN